MRPPNTKESLMANTVIVGTCWLYKGAQEHGGHCKVRWKGKKVFIHRLSAHLHWGFNMDSDVLILHKIPCMNPNCWNPEHLYEGTHQDNVNDMLVLGTFKNVIAEAESQKTNCPQGHPLDGIRGNGKRYCKTCNRIRRQHV